MTACDVTDEASVVKLVDGVRAETGRLDLPVKDSEAGLLAGGEEASSPQAQALFDLNVFVVLHVTNAVLPTMLRGRNGRIVNIDSIMVSIPAPDDVLYATTKPGLERYSESPYHELRAFGIRVACVEPRFIRPSFEDKMTKLNPSLAAYDSARAAMEVHVRNGVGPGRACEVAAETVVEAATAAAPKRRYVAGGLAREVRSMHRVVPESAFDKSLRKHNHLPG
jgi:NAD(P)-dependent dehydrogenase (short-subunit alcohol dehydrogenase family)